ncbi:MAG TPA: hypothetical protein VM694_32825, partial [Polyangium sp.]|nr:hypothetical protein [Polyangium sp.]
GQRSQRSLPILRPPVDVAVVVCVGGFLPVPVPVPEGAVLLVRAPVGTVTPPIGVGGPLPTGARTSNTAPSGTGTGTGKKPPTPTTTATSTGGRKMGSDL